MLVGGQMQQRSSRSFASLRARTGRTHRRQGKKQAEGYAVKQGACERAAPGGGAAKGVMPASPCLQASEEASSAVGPGGAWLGGRAVLWGEENRGGRRAQAQHHHLGRREPKMREIKRVHGLWNDGSDGY